MTYESVSTLEWKLKEGLIDFDIFKKRIAEIQKQDKIRKIKNIKPSGPPAKWGAKVNIGYEPKTNVPDSWKLKPIKQPEILEAPKKTSRM